MLNSKINIKSNKNIKQFFTENQLTNFIKEHIPQDASTTKYYRLNNNLLLMESTSSENKNHEFIKVSRHLKKIGLSAPKISFPLLGKNDRSTPACFNLPT